MAEETERQRLTSDQIALMHEALADQPASVQAIAARVAHFEVVSQADTDTLASALIDAMSDQGSDSTGSLNELGVKLDDVIGIVYQMSEDFFR